MVAQGIHRHETLLHRAPEVFEAPHRSNGYEYKAFMACLTAGQKECALMPPAESLAILTVLDGLRAQWGLRYPGELTRRAGD